MRLERIKIEKLFGKFDYDIKLNQEEGITILTGPNGYGKTTILKVLWGLFNNRNIYVNLYEKIICHLSDGKILVYEKNRHDSFFNTLLVFLIKDQRLDQTEELKDASKNIITNTSSFPFDESRKEQLLSSLTQKTKKKITIHSEDMVHIISETQQKEREVSDKLNATYPKRLFEYKQALPDKNNFEKRFHSVDIKYRQLMEYGIYTDQLTETSYEGEYQRALFIYLEDWEKKTAVYDDLLARTGVFLELLNKKRLADKTVTIKAGEGFCFVAGDGKKIPLDALSSGEQNETIMLFELLFLAKPEPLVLIDEPETSLHVSWQHDFLHDLKAIRAVNPLSFLIATHSPSIINENWELTQDLFDMANHTEGAPNEQS